MKYINDFNEEKYLNFFNTSGAYRDSVKIIQGVTLNENTHYMFGKFDVDQSKFNFAFPIGFQANDFDFVCLFGLIITPQPDSHIVNQGMQDKITNEWRRFICKQLTDKEKDAYIKDLKHHILESYDKFSIKQLENYLYEIRYDLPFGTINFYNINKSKFQEIISKVDEIKDYKNLLNKKHELEKYFNDFSWDIITHLRNPQTKTKKYGAYLEANEDNLMKLQQYQIMLDAFGTKGQIKIFVDHIYKSYIRDTVWENKNLSKYLSNHVLNEQRLVINDSVSTKAEEFVEKVLNYSKELEKEVLSKFEECVTIQQQLEKYEDIIIKFENLQYEYNQKLQSVGDILNFIDVYKNKLTNDKQFEK